MTDLAQDFGVADIPLCRSTPPRPDDDEDTASMEEHETTFSESSPVSNTTPQLPLNQPVFHVGGTTDQVSMVQFPPIISTIPSPATTAGFIVLKRTNEGNFIQVQTQGQIGNQPAKPAAQQALQIAVQMAAKSMTSEGKDFTSGVAQLIGQPRVQVMGQVAGQAILQSGGSTTMQTMGCPIVQKVRPPFLPSMGQSIVHGQVIPIVTLDPNHQHVVDQLIGKSVGQYPMSQGNQVLGRVNPQQMVKKTQSPVQVVQPMEQNASRFLGQVSQLRPRRVPIVGKTEQPNPQTFRPLAPQAVPKTSVPQSAVEALQMAIEALKSGELPTGQSNFQWQPPSGEQVIPSRAMNPATEVPPPLPPKPKNSMPCVPTGIVPGDRQRRLLQTASRFSPSIQQGGLVNGIDSAMRNIQFRPPSAISAPNSLDQLRYSLPSSVKTMSCLPMPPPPPYPRHLTASVQQQPVQPSRSDHGYSIQIPRQTYQTAKTVVTPAYPNVPRMCPGQGPLRPVQVPLIRIPTPNQMVYTPMQRSGPINTFTPYIARREPVLMKPNIPTVDIRTTMLRKLLQSSPAVPQMEELGNELHEDPIGLLVPEVELVEEDDEVTIPQWSPPAKRPVWTQKTKGKKVYAPVVQVQSTTGAKRNRIGCREKKVVQLRELRIVLQRMDTSSFTNGTINLSHTSPQKLFGPSPSQKRTSKIPEQPKKRLSTTEMAAEASKKKRVRCLAYRSSNFTHIIPLEDVVSIPNELLDESVGMPASCPIVSEAICRQLEALASLVERNLTKDDDDERVDFEALDMSAVTSLSLGDGTIETLSKVFSKRNERPHLNRLREKMMTALAIAEESRVGKSNDGATDHPSFYM